MNMIIKDLNELERDNHLGLYKKGHCISEQKYSLVCDYLEKINYSLQDISIELQKNPNRSVLICIIAYTCWIQESVNELKNAIDLMFLTTFCLMTLLLKKTIVF